MSTNLFVYLDTAPSLDQMRDSLAPLGLIYRHTLPADDRWDYPMHIFGRAELRVVYHEGDPGRGEAMVDGRVDQDDHKARVAMQIVLATIVRHYGGTICDPLLLQRGAVL
jgi:hypothetical protein